MRGLIVALLIFAWLPVIFFKPFIGVLVWSWVSHMVPQSYTYNFASTFPFLVVVGGLTTLGMFLSRDKKGLPGHPIIFAIFLYWIWICVTTILAFEPSVSVEKLIHLSKVLVFALVSVAIMQSPNRLKGFVWVMALSLGFIAVKGGLFTLLTGGSSRVEGAGGMMKDNNQLAMAMSMMVPIAIYLVQHPPMKQLKWPLIGGAVMVPLSVLGTQSRGGFVALAAVTAMLIMKTKHKFKLLILISVLGYAGVAFMPDSWKNRMESTEGAATEDNSFRGRVSMWKFSSNLVDDIPVQGGGFNIFYVRRAQELYMPPGFKPRAPHSIYFEVLGEHGYVGLVLFLTMLFTGWYSGGTQAKKFRQYQETVWLGDLCNAMQICIVGFAVGGLTVNIATFDVFYHVLAIIVMCNVVGMQILAGDLTDAKTGLKLSAKSASEKWQPSAAAAPQRTRF
ncbi:putative O-glycosylation ligase, exosortase A system-associated [Kordiimonas pumila]|uniref:O-glycosylation ligase, exosortase A system-associated n=1 Tax=Kordiimonas pumila TaxID=2161677 RepID=A0ABV7D0T5_9PROT|nr:putative O-glycosylation ligase, exosortase A system-associated [Kordiimonas pumila]